MKTENELIAEFMGFEKMGTFYEVRGVRHDKYKSADFGITYPAQWAFNEKWDWLMPVVEKISRIRCTPNSEVDRDTFYPRTFGMLSPESRKPMVRINRNQVHEENTLIEATYQAVVEFIKFYNSQPK